MYFYITSVSNKKLLLLLKQSLVAYLLKETNNEKKGKAKYSNQLVAQK